MTEEIEHGSQEAPIMHSDVLNLGDLDHGALLAAIAEESKERSDRLKVEKLTWKFCLGVCVIIALTPPFLYHYSIIDLYSSSFIMDEVVIGYITAFYVSSLLACRISKDYSLDKIDKIKIYKERIFRHENWGVKENEVTSELSAAMKFADQGCDHDIESARILIYVGRGWVVIATYFYISFFHLHILRYIFM